MMKKQLYLLFLLLLSVQLAIAQTTRYEYWLNNDHDGRTVVANNVTDVTLDLDISSLKPGLHYFNFRAQGDSAQWGGLSRYLFYIRENADTTASSMAQYEYWLDNQHEVRTAVKGSTSEVPLDLDISSLKPGLHYFNFRAQGKSGQWGGLSRYLFYIRENADTTASSMAQYEYWLDNNYSGRTVVNGATEDIPLNVDISQLKPGLHYFNFRAQGKSAQWGGLSRYLFYIREEADPTVASVTQYEYWLDNNYEERTVTNGAATDVLLDLDISHLKPGLHYFNVRSQSKSGQWGGMSRYLFYLREGSIQQQQLAAVEYWIDERQNVKTQQVTDSVVVITVDISELADGQHTFYVEGVSSLGTRGMLNGYEFVLSEQPLVPDPVITHEGNIVTIKPAELAQSVDSLDVNPTYYYTLDGTTPDTLSNKYESPFEVTRNCVVKAKGFQTGFKDSQVDSLVVDWFKCEMPVIAWSGDQLTATTTTDGAIIEYSLTQPGVESPLDQGGDVSPLKITVTQDVTINLYAVKTGWANSDTLVVDYPYTAWQELLAAVTDANAAIQQATGNDNVPQQMLNELESVKDTALMMYSYRTVEKAVINEKTAQLRELTDAVLRLANAQNEPYAVLTGDTISGMMLTFYYDKKKQERNGMSVGPFSMSYDSSQGRYVVNSGWDSQRESITRVVFDVSFANDTTITSTACWFYGMSNMTTIEGLRYLNTQNVTDMNYMFENCKNLTLLDVTHFDTQNVTDMSGMFDRCSSLTSLDLSGFNTQNVTSMAAMFYDCPRLTSLDVTGFNTANVTEMTCMFTGCSSLTSIDVSNFNTQNVISMRDMFCDCSGLTSLDLLGFNTQNVTSMRGMFNYCSSLTTIYVGSEWSTANVTESTDMFTGCTALVGGLGTTYDANHVDHTYAHIDGGPSNPGYFTDINGPSQKVDIPTFAWNDDILTISTTTTDAAIRYTMSDIGNGLDTLSYSAPIEVKRDVVIRAWAEHMGMITSDTISLDYPYEAWRELLVTIQECAVVAAQCEGSSKVDQTAVQNLKAWCDVTYEMYRERVASRDEIMERSVRLRTLAAELLQQLNAIDYAFDNINGVLTVGGSTTLAEALDAAGGRDEVAKTITAIVWNSTATLTNSDLQGLDNPNMLVYVQSASQAPANRDNVVIGNDSTGYTAKNIKLTDVTEGNGDFYCPIAFTAEMISYTHEYRQQTEVGVSRGWETIALPFTVQTIMHETKGLITPFGTDSINKHFWLRQLTQQGLAQARQIEANTPYLISMPNSDAYSAEFNLNGCVTFSSQNVEVPVTQLNVVEAQTGAGDMVLLQPNFKGQTATDMIYALNVGVERDGHPEGSVFVANNRSVRPFEAFTVHHGNGPAPQFISISDINGGTTGIEDVRCKMSDGRGDNWYDLNGRQLQEKPTQKGVYLNGGRKVVVVH